MEVKHSKGGGIEKQPPVRKPQRWGPATSRVEAQARQPPPKRSRSAAATTRRLEYPLWSSDLRARNVARCVLTLEVAMPRRKSRFLSTLGLTALFGGIALSCAPVSQSTRGQSNVQTRLGQTGPTSGTLNLILANKNGFVIVADSRRSSWNGFSCFDGTQSPSCHSERFSGPGFHCDDSQKLFRTTVDSAMAIAGFASDRIDGTPLELQVAEILRKKFGTKGINKDIVFGEYVTPGRTATKQVGDWVRLVLQPSLTEIAAMRKFRVPNAEVSSFTATIADVSEGKFPHIRQLKFASRGYEELEFLDTMTTWFDVEDKEFVADHFIHPSAGLDDVANQILDGPVTDASIKLDDPAIKRYLREKASNRRNQMSLREMQTLALAILRATETKYDCWVGGGDEVGVFSSKKRPIWRLPMELPSTAELPARIALFAGLAYGEGAPPPVRDRWWTEYQPPYIENDEGKIVQSFFLADSFKGVTVRVDGNYFVSDRFENVRFLYDGGETHFAADKFAGSCTVEIPSDVPIEDYPTRPGVIGRELPLLKSCQLLRRTRVAHDAWDTIGQELHLHYEECPPRKGGCPSLIPK
jgi:hypothetical protein